MSTLKLLLEENQLKTNGLKVELIERLIKKGVALPAEGGFADPDPAPLTPSHTPTQEQVVQIGKIKQLLINAGTHILSLPVEKPQWMEFEKKVPVMNVHEPSMDQISTYKQCTTAFRTFMDEGFWYNMGCPDLKDFMSWIEDGSSTADARKAFKAKLNSATLQLGQFARLSTT
eukprot:819310-Prymnesium_polylepis.1